MSAVNQQSDFSKTWPYVVKVQGILHNDHIKNDVVVWLWKKAIISGLDNKDLWTYLSNGEFGFKDPKIAVEFKLAWG